MKTTIINIFGAPGSGKSTLAAELYAEMKKQGKSVELVREAIKPWAYEGKNPTVFEQIYITNKQMLEETSLYGKVEYLITDSPILLGDFYCRLYHNDSQALFNLDHKILWEAYERQLIHQPICFFIPLSPCHYKEEGRYSSLEHSMEIEYSLKEYLSKYLNNINELNVISARCEEALKIILK